MTQPVRNDGPEPATEIVMAPTGVYWRNYGEHLSMVPTGDDNDPVLTPLVVYKQIGWEDHEGQRHLSQTVIEQIAHVIEMAEAVPSLADPRRFALGIVRAILEAKP